MGNTKANRKIRQLDNVMQQVRTSDARHSAYAYARMMAYTWLCAARNLKRDGLAVPQRVLDALRMYRKLSHVGLVQYS